MASSDPEKLAKAWATATSLHAYSVEKAEQRWRESTPGWQRPQTHEVFSVGWAFRNQEFHKRLVAAQKATLKELIAGQIIGLGRLSGSKGIDKISGSFWIDAKVEDWFGGKVSCDGSTYSEVCVVSAGAIAPTLEKASSTVGAPSRAVVIRAAIEAYAKVDPGLVKPPSVRFRAYRAYISEHGYDPRTDRGFNQKTFEKYELEYRNKNR